MKLFGRFLTIALAALVVYVIWSAHATPGTIAKLVASSVAFGLMLGGRVAVWTLAGAKR